FPGNPRAVVGQGVRVPRRRHRRPPQPSGCADGRARGRGGDRVARLTTGGCHQRVVGPATSGHRDRVVHGGGRGDRVLHRTALRHRGRVVHRRLSRDLRRGGGLGGRRPVVRMRGGRLAGAGRWRRFAAPGLGAAPGVRVRPVGRAPGLTGGRGTATAGGPRGRGGRGTATARACRAVPAPRAGLGIAGAFGRPLGHLSGGVVRCHAPIPP